MICMSVHTVLAATGATLVVGSEQVTFEGVCIDSRLVVDGAAFVAFAGEKVDGNKFSASAFEGGAHVVVITTDPTERMVASATACGGALLRAANDDGEMFMLALAKAWRNQNPQWTVVGVTGSVGKTTTKEMLAVGIGACKRTHATSGNLNSLLGVPLTLFAASSKDEVLVVEMGMNNAGELARIVEAAQPHVAVITNVGTSHIGNLGSREGIARAKAEVVSGLRGRDDMPPTLVLTDGDDFSDFIEREFSVPAGIRTLRVGAVGGAVYATSVTTDDDGLPTAQLVFADGSEYNVSLLLPGRAMVSDLLSAMGVLEALQLNRADALAAIGAMKAAHMRLEVRQEGESPRVIDDSYNASPSSMAAALDVLCSIKCEGRRIAVLGEIGELGDEAARLHALVGAYAAAKPLDLLVLIGAGDAHHMAEAAFTMGYSEDKLERFSTVDEAVRVMVPLMNAHDLVLVKASRAAGLDQFAKEVLGA